MIHGGRSPFLYRYAIKFACGITARNAPSRLGGMERRSVYLCTRLIHPVDKAVFQSYNIRHMNPDRHQEKKWPRISAALALVAQACLGVKCAGPTQSEVPPPAVGIVEPSPTPQSLLITPPPTPTETPTPTPEATLNLTPATLTLEQAKKFIAGAEYWSEEDLQDRLEGRVFRDSKTGATIVLSEAAKAALLSQIPADQLPEMSMKEIHQELAKELARLMRGSEWEKILKEIIRDNLNTEGNFFIFSSVNGNGIVINLQDDKADYQERLGWTSLMGKDLVRAKIFSIGENEIIRTVKVEFFKPNGTQYNSKNHILWGDHINSLLTTDGYTILASFDINSNTWRPILPHERKNGEYEILTPEQRMIKAMADLRGVTGYDGSGVWTEGKPTVVDYTDSQGEKHHQELKVYLVHATQDPQSPVVYEVLEDPKTGEMMFTIRQAKDNEQNIQGLNEQQAALVRQAWAYLLAADPAVMQKFWRVNKVAGVGVRYIPNLASTNWLVDGNIGLIILRNDFSDLEGPCILISGESYELYAAEFGWGDQYRYVNIPPDAVNKNAMLDAVLRKKSWFEKYGSYLPDFLRKAFVDSISFVSKYFEETTGSVPIQPQIPFEP